MPSIGSTPQSKPRGKKRTETGVAVSSSLKEELQARYTSGRTIIYAKPELKLLMGPSAMTVEAAMDTLGWENEPTYTTRMVTKDPSLTPDQCKLKEFLFKDESGLKIMCWNNAKNRPFDERWARSVAQDILNRNWMLNLENIIIGTTGLVLSGQHRLIGFVLAYQIYLKNKERYAPLWGSDPFVLETSVGLGASEDPRVVSTLDNVKPRSLADVLYTSDLFRDLSNTERKECARMLDTAIDMLWKRTGADKQEFNSYQTHSQSQEFLTRHGRLLDCVKHIFEENKERSISNLQLSPGQCAAAMYLMGSAGSSMLKYQELEVRHEKILDWGHWDEARDFWVALASGKLPHIIQALAFLADEEGGRATEKMALIAKAWGFNGSKKPPTVEQLALRYTEPDTLGKRKLDESPTFGGIDIGHRKAAPQEGDSRPPTKEEVEETKLKIRQQHLAAMKDKAAPRVVPKGKPLGKPVHVPK